MESESSFMPIHTAQSSMVVCFFQVNPTPLVNDEINLVSPKQCFKNVQGAPSKSSG